MPTPKKQKIINSIDFLKTHTDLPIELRGTKIYGKTEEEESVLHPACKVYNISNETGTGKITVYNIFAGIDLYYNDMHMAYVNKNYVAIKNMIEINHCQIGRYECSFGENSCCYMTAGDLAVISSMKKKSSSSFPLNHYHGITIIVDLDELSPEVRRLMELFNIDLDYINEYIYQANRCCIIRSNPSLEHIFAELYNVREQRKTGYMKIKMLELLLFLSDLETIKEVHKADYYNQNQVKLIKDVVALITEDLTKHYTIEQLSKQFEISATSLKKCFHGVYGTSIYAYLRIYRLQAAQKQLIETKFSIGGIAHKVGYENPNKFAAAFKGLYGITPTEFRKGVRLDR